MIITVTYYFSLLALCLLGASLLQENRLGKIAKEKTRLLKKRIDQGFAHNQNQDNILLDTGFFMSKVNYDMLRFISLILGFFGGLIIKDEKIMILIVVIFLVATPKTKIGSFNTPFGLILSAMKMQHSYKKDLEIYEAMAFLKNSICINVNNTIGSDVIIEQLAGYGDLLKPIYFKMLNLLRLNRREEAIVVFAREAGTKMSADFGRLLIQLDEISPRELEETLLSYQKNMREVKITRQKQQDEIMSDILYLPVVINVLLIFINFIYVAYFIDQKDMFGILIN